MAGKAEVKLLQLLFGLAKVKRLQSSCALVKGKVSRLLYESALLVV